MTRNTTNTEETAKIRTFSGLELEKSVSTIRPLQTGTEHTAKGDNPAKGGQR